MVVYDRFQDGKAHPFNRVSMYDAIWKAEGEGLLDRVITDLPMWPQSPECAHWGHPAWEMSLEWFRYIRMAIDAGYYALAFVDYEKRGPRSDPNHVVLLVGTRSKEIAHPSLKGAYRIDNEILVSCSSSKTPDEEWVEVHDFLAQRGSPQRYPCTSCLSNLTGRNPRTGHPSFFAL